MDDLTQRDLSGIDEADLTSEERDELVRRFDEFLVRLRLRADRDEAPPPAARPVKAWTPPRLR